jgi:hypothetical protein
MYKLLDWIPEDSLDYDEVLYNPLGEQLLRKHVCDITDYNEFSRYMTDSITLQENKDKLNWDNLSENKNAIHLLTNNEDKINWRRLSLNTGAIDLLSRNLDKVHWDLLSSNPNTIHILEQNPDKIDWQRLSSNPNAIHLIEANQDKVDWQMLSSNEGSLHILNNNSDKIHWDHVCDNISPNKSWLYKNHLSKVDSYELSSHIDDVSLLKDIVWMSLPYNPHAIQLLSQNQDKFDFKSLSHNPSIFEYDYKKMRETKYTLHQELMDQEFIVLLPTTHHP